MNKESEMGQERSLFELTIERNYVDYADLEHDVVRLRAENAELVAALERLKIAAYNIGGEHVTDWQQLIDEADVAESVLAKHRGE